MKTYYDMFVKYVLTVSEGTVSMWIKSLNFLII